VRCHDGVVEAVLVRGASVPALGGKQQRSCPGDADPGKDEGELDGPAGHLVEYPIRVAMAQVLRAGPAEPVTADVVKVPAPQAVLPGREGPPPFGAR